MKKILFLLLLIVMGITFFILKSLEYSQLEITADNYKKLKRDYEGIYGTRIEECIPDNLMLLQSLTIMYAPNCEYEQIKSESGITRVRIASKLSSLTYNVFYSKDSVAEWCNITGKDFTHDIQLKNICDKLMLSGFILKESRLKSGSDILIKETDDKFFIVEIVETYKNPNPPNTLRIGSYSKKKYFN